MDARDELPPPRDAAGEFRLAYDAEHVAYFTFMPGKAP